MQLWKKISELLVNRSLTLTKNAVIKATDATGAQTYTSVGAAEVRAAASELTAFESGKTIFLNAAAGFATTLPVPAVGLSFRFVVSTAPTGGNYTVVTNGSSNIIKGSISSADLNAASDSAIALTADTITFVQNKAIAGDFIEVISDGTSWFLSGTVSVFDGITQAFT